MQKANSPAALGYRAEKGLFELTECRLADIHHMDLRQ